jgi:hypothetical protein
MIIFSARRRGAVAFAPNPEFDPSAAERRE